ncbi:MAG TPA: hypothetical protein VLW65_07085 [Bryobacteraceae bacterium]|nr:hypothetical protein [Bryobacteraceae bacterium]
MAVIVNSFFEERVQRLFELADLVEKVFAAAGVEYRVAGGLATYLYVEQVEPDAGRLTKDIDIAVRREDMEKIAQAAKRFGLEFRHVAGLDMLVQAAQPSARRAVHLIFSGEKVRQEYAEATPELGTVNTIRGLRVIPLADLVRMKLTSFRAKDEAHVVDLDEAGLITPEIESTLSPVLRERLASARQRE